MIEYKVHYAQYTQSESSSYADYDNSACGREYFEKSQNRWEYVTCKKCLKKKPKNK